MKVSPFLMNLILYAPYTVLFFLFIIFFYRAIRFHGITKLKKFTVVMLGAFVVAFALRYFNFLFFDLVPIDLLKIGGNNNTTNLLIILMMIFFAIAIAKIRIEKNARFLHLTWLLIGLFSAIFICHLTYLYISFVIQIRSPYWAEHSAINPQAVRNIYMKQLIYPFLWVLVSCISLWKIRKEKRRL